METAYPNKIWMIRLCIKNPTLGEKEFKVALTEAIDESLSSFSMLDKQEINLYLKNIFNIKKTEIPCKIEDFIDAIEQMFGIGANLIEIKIIEALHKKIPEFIFYPKGTTVLLKEYISNLHTFLVQT